LLVCPVVILFRWYSKQLQLVPISGSHIVGLKWVPVLYDDFRFFQRLLSPGFHLTHVYCAVQGHR
jgi:hypothetical protein